MKKETGARTKKLLSSAFNLRLWFDWDRVSTLTTGLVDWMKRYFVPQNKKVEENFETAVKRLHLTEADLLQKQKSLFRLAVLMSTIAGLVFLYSLYLLYTGSYHALILGLVVVMIALVLAFRYHFWYFQIKMRKLGCSIQEWFRDSFRGNPS